MGEICDQRVWSVARRQNRRWVRCDDALEQSEDQLRTGHYGRTHRGEEDGSERGRTATIAFSPRMLVILIFRYRAFWNRPSRSSWKQGRDLRARRAGAALPRSRLGLVPYPKATCPRRSVGGTPPSVTGAGRRFPCGRRRDFGRRGARDRY